MQGTIRRRDILSHPWTTVQCFGWRVFARALFAGEQQTFLSLLAGVSLTQVPGERAGELVGRCAELERSIMELYDSMAARFTPIPAAAVFFRDLARQERGHAELLELCRAAAGRAGWDEALLDSWSGTLPEVEEQVPELLARAEEAADLGEAMALVVQIESGELNHVYQGIVTASESEFVQKLAVFRRAGWQHIEYLCGRIPTFEPGLLAACQELEQSYAAVVT